MINPDDDMRHLDRLLDRFRQGDLDRRRFLVRLGLAGLAAGVLGGPLAGAARAAAQEIRYESWGGHVAEAIRRTAIAIYAQTNGGKVVEGTFGSEEEVLAKAKAGRPGDYNVVYSAGLSWYKRWLDAGFGVELREANIPNLANVMPALIEPFRRVNPKGLSGVPFAYGSNGIAYNTRYISHEQARAERENLLLRPDLKGKLSGYNDFQTRMWVAALQTGQDPNDIRDLDAVWAKIRENRALVKKYWSSGAEAGDLMASEEVYVEDIWSGRAAALMARLPHIGYVEFSRAYGSILDMLVLKGSPVEACEQFLNILLEPDVAIAVAEAQLYPPPLDPNKVALPAGITALPAFDPAGTLSQFDFPNPDYWPRNEKDWKPIYARVARGF